MKHVLCIVKSLEEFIVVFIYLFHDYSLDTYIFIYDIMIFLPNNNNNNKHMQDMNLIK